MIFIFCILLLEVLFGCMSQTIPNQRFADSVSLTPPLTTVSVSNPNSFTFAAVGDLHVGNQDTSRLQRILSAAAAEGDAFIVLLGDIVDGGDQEDVQAVRTTLANAGFGDTVAPVIGNHDIFGSGWQAYKALNGPSHYSFTAGNSQFIVIDTADGTVAKPEQDWLISQLNQGGFTNRFLLSHYLPIVPGIETYLKFSDDMEALHLMRLLLEAKATAWIGGHYHSYIADVVAGLQVVVAGGGGGRRMPPVSNFFFVQVVVNGSNVTFNMRQVS